MKVYSKLKEYEVLWKKDSCFIDELSAIPNAIYVIDKKVYQLYHDMLSSISDQRMILVEAAESNKILDTALDICEKITDLPAKRNAVLISVGGGIIQDITGFAANIIYRGIYWIFVPTTLLAACDSCIGGKTSLNYKKFKNLLGTFYPPDRIYIYSHFFKTLSDKDYKSGLGEVVKFNIMSGQQGLEKIEENLPALLERNTEKIDEFVRSSLTYKKTFIEKDEFDQGERIKLNFAHTFGHAIEVVTEYEIPHGTAVAAGMVMANRISEKRGFLNQEILRRSSRLLLKVIDIDIALLRKPLSDYIRAIHKDKKQQSNSLTAVLITEYETKGQLAVVHDVTEDEIQDAINWFITTYEEEK